MTEPPKGAKRHLRLIVPNWYGVASVKWLKRIDVITDEYEGEFQVGHYMYERPDQPHEPVTLMRVRAPGSPTPLPARPSPPAHRPCAERPGRAPDR